MKKIGSAIATKLRHKNLVPRRRWIANGLSCFAIRDNQENR
ncbi:hypothetical protein DSM3645_21969 [Blastopirellula marina DSM 3645]|uniref:Uncharacterized protein n=1 Tax=Blastopirellula marina DSM 3645 TaxID=314230 RepID=A3ZUE2_9BACT|nr:hypothetical protein DSM3645_21969 [Blastopirellula marina DSM 3645]